MSIECVRIYSDNNGETHFGASPIDMEAVHFAPPAPPIDVSEMMHAHFGFLRAPVGWFGDWHPAPARQLMTIVSGTLEVCVSDGESRQLGPGAVVLVEDTTGRGHTTRVLGDVPAVLTVAQLG